MEKLQKEMEQLREQRNQQKQLADSNGRQRDMYRILLSQSTGFSLPPQGTQTPPVNLYAFCIAGTHFNIFQHMSSLQSFTDRVKNVKTLTFKLV